MALPTKELSAQGYEMQFAVNHLGHFALSVGLHDAGVMSRDARVVSVSSQAHSFAPIDFDDINFDARGYDPTLAYCQSKTANALFAVTAARHWADDGICVNAVTPGAIPTNLQVHNGGFTVQLPDSLIKTPAQGAATNVLCAASPLLEGVTGKYFANCNEAFLVDERLDDMTGVLPFAIDPEIAERLWNVSAEMINIHF
jgi:NAD(P)-dependent dehydrogenase (short-subunit alcohol dehydrogenase family)